MTAILGQGAHSYRVETGWAKLPDGWFFGDVGGVGVDSHDNVYVFNRGAHPVIVLDRDGNFLRSWGEGLFTRPHGVHMGPDDTLYLTDDGDHSVRRCTVDGRVLMTIGVPKQPTPYMAGLPFHRCTHTALSPKGEIYVSDGYGNARVHKYAPDGKLLKSWGEPGTDPGCFNIVHNVCCDADGWVYVADRENHRVQVFDRDGRYETQWNNLHRPSALWMPHAHHPVAYIGEGGPGLAVNKDMPNCGPRISITTHEGKLIARLGDIGAGLGDNQFIAPHGMCVDSHGDIYVGEVTRAAWRDKYSDEPVPEKVRSFRKLVKIG